MTEQRPRLRGAVGHETFPLSEEVPGASFFGQRKVNSVLPPSAPFLSPRLKESLLFGRTMEQMTYRPWAGTEPVCPSAGIYRGSARLGACRSPDWVPGLLPGEPLLSGVWGAVNLKPPSPLPCYLRVMTVFPGFSATCSNECK